MSTVERAPNPEQLRGDRGAGRRLRLGRRRHRQDDRARRALRARGLRARARRRLDPRDHLHRARGRRAARADPRAARRARPPRPRARARRRLDLDHPRLLPPAAAGAPVRGRARPALPRARREPGAACSAARRSTRRSTSSAPSGEPERLRLLATYGGRGLRRMLTGVYETLRSAGRAARARARRAARARASGSSELREAAALPRRRRGDRDAQRERRGGARAARRRRALPSGCSTSATCRRAASAPRRTRRRASASSRPRSTSSPRATASCSRSCSSGFAAAYRRGEGPRVGARLRGPPAARARPAARRTTRSASASSWRFRSIMVDEFQDTNRLQCELVDLLAQRGRRALLRRRRVPVDLPLPARRRRGLPRAARRRPAACCADAELPLAARGARRRQPPLRAPTSATSSSRSPPPGGSPTRSSGRPSSCSSPTRRATQDTGVALAARPRRAHVARRVRELVDAGEARAGRDRPPLRRRHRRASATRRSCARAGLPTYRATGRGYFGQQQVVDLLAYLRLLHNRYDDEALVTVLASPFVGVSNDALVAAAPRGADGGRSSPGSSASCPTGSAERDERLFRAFRQRYERLGRARRALSLERLCEQIVAEHDYDLAVLAQWDGRRRYANLRKLGAARALVRGAARAATSRASSASSREQEAVGARELEAVAEEEGADAVRLLTIHAAKGLEFKVVVVADAGRDRRAAGGRRDPLPPGRAASASASPTRSTGKRRGAFDYEEVQRRASRTAERGRAAAPLLRRDDARDRPADRLRLDRPERSADAGDADRLGARPARGRASSTSAGERARSSSSATARGCSCASTATRRAGAAPPSRPPTDGAARALRRRGERRRGAARRRRSRRSPRCRRRRSTACAGSRTARSRSSSAARTATTPSASSGMRPGRRAARRSRRRRGSRRPRSATPSTGCSSASTSRAPAPPGPRAGARLVPGGDRRGARADRAASSRRTATRSSRARVAASTGARPERPFAFEHDGVLLHGRLDVLHRDGARALVVDYKTNSLGEAHARGDRRARLPAAAARLRARVLPRRRGGGRGRLPVPRAPGRGRRRPTFTRRRAAGARGGALGGDRADPGGRVPADAERVRLRRLPGARPRLRRPAALRARRLMAAQLRRRGAAARRARSASGSARSSSGSLAEHPDATIALRFRSDLELLVSVMLSAQTTDVNVNRVTEQLFREVPPARGLPRRAASRSSSATSSRPASSARRRRRCAARCAMLLEEYDGEVPRTARGARAPARRRAQDGERRRGRARRGRRGSSSTRTSAGSRSGSASRRQDDPVKIERDLMRLVPRARLGPSSRTC